MEIDVHGSNPECYIIDRKEDLINFSAITVTAKSSDSQSLENSSLNHYGDTSNQDKKCGYCSAIFSNQEELVSHLKTIHTLICTECDQTFLDNKALALHMKKHTSKKKWVCEFCYKVYNYRSLLEQHSRSHLGLKPFKCDKCEKQFSRLYNLQIHKNKHTSPKAFDCSHCSQKFSHSSHLSKHVRKSHATHQCKLCPRYFPDSESLDKHQKTHNATEPALSGKRLSCEFCKKTFNTLNRLNLHLQRHANEAHFPMQTNAKRPLHKAFSQPHKKIKFKCEFCSKSFLKYASFSHHLKTHPSHEDKEYFCKLCSNQKFASAKQYFKHQKIKHGKSTLVCEYCQKEFLFHSLYKQHVRKHTGEKPFCCPYCKKSFARLFYLKIHVKQHETTKRPSEKKTGEVAPNHEQQMETYGNDFPWNGSINVENGSSFGENCQNNSHIPDAMVSCQDVNNAQIGKNRIVRFEYSSLKQHNVSDDGYFPELINNTVPQYNEEVPPISSIASSNSMYMDERTAERDNEDKTTFQNSPIQYQSIFIPNIENQLLSKNLQRNSPTLSKEPAVFSVEASDEETPKSDEDLSVTLEILSGKQNGVLESKRLDCQPVPSNELTVIPVTDSSIIDSYTAKTNKDSYVINLGTDLPSRTSTKEDISITYSNMSNDYMLGEQISTDAVAANNSRILQYLNSQTPESNLILEVNNSLEETSNVNNEISEISVSGSDLIDLTDEINDANTNVEFKCSYCEMVCPSSELLSDHLKLHTVKKPFVCGYCQKSFRYSSLLEEHIRNHREQIRSFHCGQCPKTFSSHKSLVLHQETHKTVHKEPPETLLSGDCGQQFSSSKELSQHKCMSASNVHTNFPNISNLPPKMNSGGSKNKTKGKNNVFYTCEYCGKEFKYHSLLTQHLRSHTGEKPYTCGICPKSFTRPFNLKMHQKQHVKRGQASALPSTILRPVGRKKKVATSLSSNRKKSANNLPSAEILPVKRGNTRKGKKPYSCNFCDQSFIVHKDLKRHQHDRHRPFICKLCKKEFQFCSMYLQHVKRHTGKKKT